MGNFLVPITIGLGANLLLSLLAPKPPAQERGKIEDTGVPDAEYGTPLSQPIGRVRKDGISMIWALPLKEVVKRTGGGKSTGGQQTKDYSYFLSAAFLIGGKIQSVRRVWMNSELVYASDAAGGNVKSDRFLEHFDIYLGDQTTASSTILAAEPNNTNVPSLKDWSYIVSDKYPIAEYNGSGFPRVDIEVIGALGDEPMIKDVLRYICQKAGIPDNRIDTSGLNDDRIFGYDLKLDGTSFAEQLNQVARIGMVIIGETRDRIVFKSQTRSAENVYFIPKPSLGARLFGSNPIELYEKKQTHFREIPSSVTIDYLNPFKDHDNGSITAKDPSATWDNELSFSSGVVASDLLIGNTASRLLYLGRSQSISFSKISLLPAWNNIKVGDLISVDYTTNFHRETVQVTKKSLGQDYLIELEGVRYQGTANECFYVIVYDLGIFNNPSDLNNVTRTQRGTVFGRLVFSRAPLRVETSLPLGQVSPTSTTEIRFYDGNNNLVYSQNTNYGLTVDSTWGVVTECNGVTVLGGNTDQSFDIDNPYESNDIPVQPPAATVIALETALIKSQDSDLGFYVAIEEEGEINWRGGGLFYSTNDGATWDLALEILASSVIGEVISFNSYFTSANPDLIDTTSTIRVRILSGESRIEPVTEDVFLAGGQIGLFNQELIAFKNVTIITNDPLTVDIDYLIRGVQGTELDIPAHSVGEKFILMTGYKVRLPVNSTDINRQVLLKAVPSNLAETEITTEVSHLVALESVKPFLPVVATSRANNVVTVTWARRTRVNGQLVDYVDIPFAAGELDSYTVRVYAGGSIVRETVITGAREFIYTEALQIEDWGSVLGQYQFRVFQNSSFPVPFPENTPAILG